MSLGGVKSVEEAPATTHFLRKVYYTKQKKKWEVSQNHHDIVVSKTKELSEMQNKPNYNIYKRQVKCSSLIVRKVDNTVHRLNHYPLDKCEQTRLSAGLWFIQGIALSTFRKTRAWKTAQERPAQRLLLDSVRGDRKNGRNAVMT